MVKCYDVASMVIQNATKKLMGNYKQNDYLNEEFKKLCDSIDRFLIPDSVKGCNESYGIDVDVDLDTLEIVVGVHFDMFEFSKQDPIYDVIKSANDIKISCVDDNTIRVEMRFSGVWDEVF